MSFIVKDDLVIVGMFSPNGFQTIKPGAPVTIVFDNHPGRRYHATITEIPLGVGQGQVSVSGVLARSGSIRGVSEYPAVISTPEDLDPKLLRVGMPGNATVFADNAGVIGIIASILIWISSYTAYL
jgi:multidrug resistance efflux pump